MCSRPCRRESPRRKVQRGRAGRAVVVDVEDRDAGHAQLVDRPLARGRLTVAVADVALLDLAVVDARVRERLGAGLLRHVRVVPVPAARLLELRHADADDVDLVRHRTPLYLTQSRIVERYTPGCICNGRQAYILS